MKFIHEVDHFKHFFLEGFSSDVDNPYSNRTYIRNPSKRNKKTYDDEGPLDQHYYAQPLELQAHASETAYTLLNNKIHNVDKPMSNNAAIDLLISQLKNKKSYTSLAQQSYSFQKVIRYFRNNMSKLSVGAQKEHIKVWQRFIKMVIQKLENYRTPEE